jgi:hypothetical protein
MKMILEGIMIDLSDKYLLMIEPDQEGIPSEKPIEDELSRKVDFIFSKCKPSTYASAGTHKTRCGKYSDNVDWILPNGIITNSLCKYYIKFYREYIPSSEIDKVNTLFDKLHEKTQL